MPYLKQKQKKEKIGIGGGHGSGLKTLISALRSQISGSLRPAWSTE
jgi:uridine kinase